jgi:hypothetical protein
MYVNKSNEHFLYYNNERFYLDIPKKAYEIAGKVIPYKP